MTRAQLENPQNITQYEMELFFWNYKFAFGILQSSSKHQEYLDFWYTDLIDKIGMNSMVIETDMAGNYVGSSYGWATTRIGLSLACCIYIKETGTGNKFLMKVG
jgi:hypothetical protein